MYSLLYLVCMDRGCCACGVPPAGPGTPPRLLAHASLCCGLHAVRKVSPACPRPGGAGWDKRPPCKVLSCSAHGNLGSLCWGAGSFAGKGEEVRASSWAPQPPTPTHSCAHSRIQLYPSPPPKATFWLSHALVLPRTLVVSGPSWTSLVKPPHAPPNLSPSNPGSPATEPDQSLRSPRDWGRLPALPIGAGGSPHIPTAGRTGHLGQPKFGEQLVILGEKNKQITPTEREPFFASGVRVKCVPSSSGQYQACLPPFLSLSLCLSFFSHQVFLFLILYFFFFFFPQKIMGITVNASQPGCASRAGHSPNPEPDVPTALTHSSFSRQRLSPCPSTQQGDILSCAHSSPCIPSAALAPSPGGQQVLGWGQDIHSVPLPSACPAKLIPPLPGKGEKLPWEVMGKQQPQPAPARTQEFCKCSTCTNFFMAVFAVVPCEKWTCVSLLIT